MNSRRSFLKLIPAALGACALAPTLLAQTGGKIDETDPTAAALGYKHDATKTDVKKYPQYKAGSICANCALYAGKPGDPTGPCMALANKIVDAKGWCMVYAKKP
ncbi:MAG: hypothetical protein RL376_63 [Verrucomicrobiota bacterium]